MTREIDSQGGADPFGLETLAVRAGQERSQFGEHAEALYLTSSFVFESAAQAAARFSGEEAGNVYSRFTNPTVTAFQARLAANPEDFEARCELATALNAAGRREEAAGELLHVIRADRGWKDGAARQQLLRFFEAWGNDDPNTLTARRRLSSLLFS